MQFNLLKKKGKHKILYAFVLFQNFSKNEFLVFIFCHYY